MIEALARIQAAAHLLRLASVILRLRAHQILHGIPTRNSWWQDWEVDALRELYPWFSNRELAGLFHRPPGAIKTRGQKADRLCKDPETIKRIRRDIILPSALETRFQPGWVPHTWRPVGTVVRDPGGYLKRKVSDHRDIPSRLNWRFIHVELWERHHGPVPKGMNVVFRNGDKTDIRIANLELVSDADLMRRNTRHRYPEEINLAIGAKARLTRVINELERRTQ